jgi:hypothetical protein
MALSRARGSWIMAVGIWSAMNSISALQRSSFVPSRPYDLLTRLANAPHIRTSLFQQTWPVVLGIRSPVPSCQVLENAHRPRLGQLADVLVFNRALRTLGEASSSPLGTLHY